MVQRDTEESYLRVIFCVFGIQSYFPQIQLTNQVVTENRHETEQSRKTQDRQCQLQLPGGEDNGLSVCLSPDSHAHLCPDGVASNQPSPEKPNSDALPVASIVSMTPMNPVPECSGIVPQLQ